MPAGRGLAVQRLRGHALQRLCQPADPGDELDSDADLPPASDFGTSGNYASNLIIDVTGEPAAPPPTAGATTVPTLGHAGLALLFLLLMGLGATRWLTGVGRLD